MDVVDEDASEPGGGAAEEDNDNHDGPEQGEAAGEMETEGHLKEAFPAG